MRVFELTGFLKYMSLALELKRLGLTDSERSREETKRFYVIMLR